MSNKLKLKYSTWKFGENQCPNCVQEVKNGQIRCDICGTRLIKVDSINNNKSGRIQLEFMVIPNIRAVLYSLLIAISLILIKALYGKYYGKILENNFGHMVILYYFLCILLGIIIGNSLYKITNYYYIILLSIIFYGSPIILIRLLGLYLDYNISLIVVELMIEVVFEIIFIFGSAVILINTFQKMELKYNYGKISKVIEDKSKNQKYDIGICSICNQTTKIKEGRSFSLLESFIGRKPVYFCDNCSSYIKGNPIANSLVGLSEAIILTILLIGWVMYHRNTFLHSKIDIIETLILLAVFCGIMDGLTRLYNSLIATIKT